MGSHVLAFSINKTIEQIGSIAGLASVLGLAVLSLLYFAQAREVKRLREWAGRAPERDAELQQRVAEEAARRATGVPPGAPPPAAARPATAAAQATAAKLASAPKPPAAPATAAGQTAPAAKPATPPGAPAPAGSPAAPAKPAAPAPGGAPAPAAGTPAPVAKPPAPAPGVPKPAGTPAPATPAGAGPPAARPRRTVTVGSTPSSATVPPRRDEPEARDRMFNGRVVGATAGAAVLVVVLLFVTGVVGGGDEDNAPPTVVSTTETTAPSGAEIPAPAETPTAVLNGTAVTGLARQAADRLVARDYNVSRVTDAADQQQQVSHVAYSEGFEEAAKRVARIIGISASQVMPLDASTAAIAGDEVSVVVTMGLDKAQ